MSKRSKYVIIRDILQCVLSESGANEGSIIRNANLDYRAFIKNINILSNKGFIYQNGRIYHITNEGKAILAHIIELLGLIGEK